MPINISLDLEIIDAEEQFRLGAVLASLGAALQESSDSKPIAKPVSDSNVVQLEQPKGRGRPRKTEQEPVNPQEALQAVADSLAAGVGDKIVNLLPKGKLEGGIVGEPVKLSAETAVDDGTEIVPVQPQELQIAQPEPTIKTEPPTSAAPASASAEETALRDKLKATMREALGKNLATAVQKVLGDHGATSNKNVKAEDLNTVIGKIEELISAS